MPSTVCRLVPRRTNIKVELRLCHAKGGAITPKRLRSKPARAWRSGEPPDCPRNVSSEKSAQLDTSKLFSKSVKTMQGEETLPQCSSESRRRQRQPAHGRASASGREALSLGPKKLVRPVATPWRTELELNENYSPCPTLHPCLRAPLVNIDTSCFGALETLASRLSRDVGTFPSPWRGDHVS